MVAAIEKEHEERYRTLLLNVKNEMVFLKDGDAIWQCSNCGHIVIGQKAPDVCPRMQASAGIFPDESRKLLSEIPNNAEKER